MVKSLIDKNNLLIFGIYTFTSGGLIGNIDDRIPQIINNFSNGNYLLGISEVTVNLAIPYLAYNYYKKINQKKDFQTLETLLVDSNQKL